MDLGIKGRTAIVSASSRGLGKAVALGLAKEGASLALCARNDAVLQATADEIRRQTGVEVYAVPVDVCDNDRVKEFVGEALRRFGHIDICITNAGGPPAKSFAETSIEDWQNAVRLNLMSTIYFAREVLPHMQKQKWGRVITITSASVKQPIDNLILSNSVRSAVSGLMKSLSNEYARDNVLINNVCPGYTLTSRLEELSSKLSEIENVEPGQIQERWAKQTAVQRLGKPDEFANLVVFLASERASYINGVSIAVDGGLIKGIY